eukprot:SAG31_NODE_14763_length_788_cov_3.150943_1_plen_27_part_10
MASVMTVAVRSLAKPKADLTEQSHPFM